MSSPSFIFCNSANGAVLQGLVKPGTDLSRGGTGEDVVNTVILTVLQGAL